MALALAVVPGAARAANYAQALGTPGGIPVGTAAISTATCGSASVAATVAMATSGTACSNNSVALSTRGADVIAFVATTAYSAPTFVTGSATSSVVIQTSGTTNNTRHTFTAQLGYVTGTNFVAFAGTGQSYPLTSTTPYQWTPNFASWSGTAPAGSYLAVKVGASSTQAATATVYFGTSVATLGVASGTFTVTEAAAGTTAGAASAAQTSGATPSIAVSAPYTGDANANNTISYRYRLAGGTYGPSLGLPHAASPYAFTIPGLDCGSSYDVEVTYADPDGVTGTAVQTISAVALTSCTTTGAIALDGSTCAQATASAAFTGDADGDGSTTYDRAPSATGPWTSNVCTRTGASPRACTDVIAPGTYWYRATFSDPDGVSGTNPVVSGSSVAVTSCAVNSTTAGAVSATAGGTATAPTLAIGAGYADDADADNTLSYRLRTPSGSGSWSGSTTVSHAASPYAVNASVACGSSYDVEVTFVDADGVTGANPTTISNVQTVACPTIAAGDASTGEATTTLAPGAAAVALDAFTLQTSAGVVAPTSITVAMPAGSATLVAQLTLEDSAACDHVAAHATISSPVSDTVTFTGITGLPVSTSPTNLWVCLTPKTQAAMPAPPGSQIAVTGQVTDVVATGYTTLASSDVASAPRTIDNLSPSAAGSFAGTLTGTQVSFTWSNPADGAQAVVLRWTGSAAGSEVPQEGKAPDYAAGNTIGTATVACVVNAPGSTCADTALISGTTYAYAIFSRDANLNWSVAAPSTPASFTPSVPGGTTTLVSSSDPATTTICPGGTAYVDRFGFTVTGASDTIGTITFGGLGASAPLASIEIRDDGGNPLSPARTATPFGDTYLFGSASLVAPAGATTWYRLYVTAKPWSALAPGEIPIQPAVQSFGSLNAPGGSDSANGFVVDGAPPAQAAWRTNTPGAGQIQLAWTNPTDAALQRVFVLRRESATAFTETFPGGSLVPAQGTFTAAGSWVLYSGAATSGAPVTFTDTGVVEGTAYEYRVYAVDACGNFNDGAASGPWSPTGPFVAEGSITPGAPMISIVNPKKGGVVTGKFRVQVRVYNPVAQGGITDAVAGSLAYSLDDGNNWTTGGFTALAGYDTSTSGTLTGRTYELQLTPGAGRYTLRATVSSSLVSNVVSNGVPITAVGQVGGGDGRLLVRDNSSQLCADCHASHAHTSETTQSDKGSWATVCRDCHAPHGTRNLYLVSEQITPPAIQGATSPKTVTFYSTSGRAPNSFATGSGSGVCEVCHTQTKFYRADGTSPGGTHEIGPCMSCHNHSKGLAASCTTCHGTDGRPSVAGADSLQPAAPPGVAPAPAVSVANGGAHLAHVNRTTWRSVPLGCRECHAIPNTHQGTTDVAWGAIAGAGGLVVQPATGTISSTWTPTPTCTNWCHGAGLAGGGGTNDGVASPIWTGTSAACGSCHASPPPVGGTPERVHPQNFSCASCHGGDYARTSIGPTSKATHIDGTIQKPAMGCTACHGTLAGLGGAPVASGSMQAAPGYDPGVGALGVDTHGNGDRTIVSVGAHDRHVDPAMMTPKACGICHGGTPADGDTSHANGAIATGFTFPANAGGVTPAPAAFASGWEASPSCTNYCHSSGKPIGAYSLATVSPVWTSTTAMSCTSCHGNAATLATNAHPKHAATYTIACQACHAGTTDDGQNIVLGGGLHVDGTNSVRFTTTDVLWAPLVTGASYDDVQHTCSAYCHSNGTSSTAPFGAPVGGALPWTGTTSCTSCHGGPSGAGIVMGVGAGNGSAKHANHVANDAVIGRNYFCGDCHQATVAAGSNTTFSNRANHVDRVKTVSIANRGTFASADTTSTCGSTYCHSSGQATPVYVSPAPTWADAAWTTVCNKCHGRSNATGAPDYANGGPGAATANSHAKHTSSGTDATSCQNCHSGTVTASGTAILGSSTLHTNGARDVTIAAAYDTNGATPNYDSTTKTCTSVTCHGTGSPQWGATLGCTGCHGDANRTSIAGADTNQKGAPPFGLAGETLSSTRAVGAHVAHVNQADLRTNPLPCSECHLNATHDGVKQVAWGTLATTGGRAPNWTGTTCQSTYCHAPGGAEAGGSIREPSWTGTSQAACGTCHGAPPPVGGGIAGADHPQNTTCTSCHGAGYSLASAATATHINGSTVAGTDKPANGCTGCHGVLAGVAGGAVANTSMTAAPGYVGTTTGVDTTGSSAVSSPKVGAHDAHVRGHIGATVALDCTNCHGTKPAPNDTTHANGTIAIGWSALATRSGALTPAPAAFGTGFESSPSCSSNYCHSNGNPATGTPATSTLTWTSSTAMTCTSCHAASGQDASGVATDLSQKHGKHVNLATYAFRCDECHALTMQNDSATAIGTPANHVNGGKEVKFSSTLLTIAPAIDQSAGSYIGGTCSATYCHSGGVATAAPFSATASAAMPWTTGTSSCRECHGWTNAARPTIGVATSSLFQGSAKHAAHVDNAGVVGTNFACADCHNDTVASGNSPITNFTKHVNGTKDVKIGPRGTVTSNEPYTGGSCSATYCHSSGQATPAFVSPAPAWTDAAWTTVCNKCHGRSNATGAPDYSNGGAGSPTANSHAKHTANGTDATTCQNCHAATVTAAGTAIAPSSTSHVNGARDVSILSTYDTNGATPNYDGTSKTCSAVSCHGSGTPQWGGAASCTGCHGTTGAENTLTEMGANFWSDGTAAVINTGEWSWSGHGKASGTYDVTGNPAAAFPTTPTAGLSECLYCHDDAVAHGVATNPFRLRGATDVNGVSSAWSSAAPNAICLDCHATNGANGVDPDGTGTAYAKKTGTAKADTAHVGTKHDLATMGGKFCWDCHDPHGDRSSTNGGNIAMIRANVTAVSDGTYGYLGASGVSRAVTYTAEAALSPATGKAVELDTTAGQPHFGICQACHSATSETLLDANAWTKYWNRFGYDDPDGVGGAAPVTSAHNSTSTSTPYCISCHAHGGNFAGESGGGVDCTSCHSDLLNRMNSASSGYHHYLNNGWSGSTSGSGTTTYPTTAWTSSQTDTNRRCLACHVDHNLFRPDLNASGARAKNLRTDYAATPTATTNLTNTDFDGTLTNGGICVSCHATARTKSYTQPDGTTTTPVIGKASYQASVHNFNATSTFGTDGSTFNANCSKCHTDTRPKARQSSAYPNQFGLHDGSLRRISNRINDVVVTGTATGTQSTASVVDTSANWTPDQFAGWGVAISDANGTRSGVVKSNTGTTLTMVDAWATAPINGTTTYTIDDPMEERLCIQCHSGAVAGNDAFGAKAMSAASRRFDQYLKVYGTGTATTTVGGTGLTGSGTTWFYSGTGATFTNGSATVSGLSGVTAGMLGWSIKNTADAPARWYSIVATSGTSSVTISPNYAGTTTTSGSWVIGIGDWYFKCDADTSGQWYRVIDVTGATAATIFPAAGTACSNGGYLVRSTPGHPMSVSDGRHRPDEATGSGWNPSTARHVTCADCHDPHEAQAGRHTPGSTSAANLGAVNTGAWGVTVTYASRTCTGGTFAANGTTVTTTASCFLATDCQGGTGCTGTQGNKNISVTDGTGASYVVAIKAYGSATSVTTSTYRGQAISGTASFTIGDPSSAPTYGVATSLTTSSSQYQLCLKCHSSYAYGATPPNTSFFNSSGQGAVAAQTDVAKDFNPWQFGYHPIMAVGRNQPSTTVNANWASSAGRKVTSAAYPSNPTTGLDNTFVDGWGRLSMVACTDCHQSESAGDPWGPHGTANPWLLKGIDPNVTVTIYNAGTATVTYPNACYYRGSTAVNANVPDTGDTKNLCLNCHRADVYGLVTSGGSSTGTSCNAAGTAQVTPITYAVLSRQSHPVDQDAHSNSVAAGLTRRGITCLQCHGGATVGGIHGSNQATGSSGTSYRGKRLLNGSAWQGHTRATTSAALSCVRYSTVDAVNTCTNTSTSGTKTANYDYDGGAD